MKSNTQRFIEEADECVAPLINKNLTDLSETFVGLSLEAQAKIIAIILTDIKSSDG